MMTMTHLLPLAFLPSPGFPLGTLIRCRGRLLRSLCRTTRLRSLLARWRRRWHRLVTLPRSHIRPGLLLLARSTALRWASLARHHGLARRTRLPRSVGHLLGHATGVAAAPGSHHRHLFRGDRLAHRPGMGRRRPHHGLAIRPGHHLLPEILRHHPRPGHHPGRGRTPPAHLRRPIRTHARLPNLRRPPSHHLVWIRTRIAALSRTHPGRDKLRTTRRLTIRARDATRMRHAILLLPRHQQPLLVLLLEKHQLHLVVLERMVPIIIPILGGDLRGCRLRRLVLSCHRHSAPAIRRIELLRVLPLRHAGHASGRHPLHLALRRHAGLRAARLLIRLLRRWRQTLVPHVSRRITVRLIHCARHALGEGLRVGFHRLLLVVSRLHGQVPQLLLRDGCRIDALVPEQLERLGQPGGIRMLKGG